MNHVTAVRLGIGVRCVPLGVTAASGRVTRSVGCASVTMASTAVLRVPVPSAHNHGMGLSVLSAPAPSMGHATRGGAVTERVPVRMVTPVQRVPNRARGAPCQCAVVMARAKKVLVVVEFVRVMTTSLLVAPR